MRHGGGLVAQAPVLVGCDAQFPTLRIMREHVAVGDQRHGQVRQRLLLGIDEAQQRAARTLLPGAPGEARSLVATQGLEKGHEIPDVPLGGLEALQAFVLPGVLAAALGVVADDIRQALERAAVHERSTLGHIAQRGRLEASRLDAAAPVLALVPRVGEELHHLRALLAVLEDLLTHLLLHQLTRFGHAVEEEHPTHASPGDVAVHEVVPRHAGVVERVVRELGVLARGRVAAGALALAFEEGQAALGGGTQRRLVTRLVAIERGLRALDRLAVRGERTRDLIEREVLVAERGLHGFVVATALLQAVRDLLLGVHDEGASRHEPATRLRAPHRGLERFECAPGLLLRRAVGILRSSLGDVP